MAQSQGDDILRPRAKIEEGTDLHEDWQAWQEQFKFKSEAVTEAMRRGLQGADLDEEGQQSANSVLAGAAVAVLTVAVGQTFLAAGGIAAAGLTLVSLGAAALGTQLPLERIP